MTGFAKIRLIAGECNCSYSQFCHGSHFLSIMFLGQKIKSMTLLLYIYIVIIEGELSKDYK